MRWDELFHVVPRVLPSSLLPRQQNRIIRRTFRPSSSPPFFLPSFLSAFFLTFLCRFSLAAFSRARSSLNSSFIPRFTLLLSLFLFFSLHLLHARARNLPGLPARRYRSGYSPATLFFLTFPRARGRARGKCGASTVPCSCATIERYHREFTSRNTTT